MRAVKAGFSRRLIQPGMVSDEVHSRRESQMACNARSYTEAEKG